MTIERDLGAPRSDELIAAVPAPTERVLVVSLMKSGTHLIQELMVALGYGIYGQSRIGPDIRPLLNDDTLNRVARMVYEEAAMAVATEAGSAGLSEAGTRAWEALGWAWQLRLGMPLANRYGVDLINMELIAQAVRRTAASGFFETPSGVCWILPELDVTRIDGQFLREWSTTGLPKVIFNYRDPRDVLLSMVNFLAGRTTQGIGNFSEFQPFSRILQSKPSLDEQLTYALTDPSFPGLEPFRRSLWLLHHPDVCKISFEELVGSQGGGTVEAQHTAVERIIQFVGSSVPADTVTGRLFRRDAFSFFRGEVGAWRTAFTDVHHRLFADRFGEIPAAYGYE